MAISQNVGEQWLLPMLANIAFMHARHDTHGKDSQREKRPKTF